MEVDIYQLPIPDWGLTCPRCRYLLRGLPSHRCPECGGELDMPTLIRPWTRLRPPRFSGDELPLPDFGLTCAACGHPLAGAATRRCGSCGEPFDPQALRPPGPWFVLDGTACGSLTISAVQLLFAREHVPYLPVNEKTVFEIYGGHRVLFSRLRVPGEFFFDVLWLLREAERELAQARSGQKPARWRCARCGERNPGNFEICWNCGEAQGAGAR